MRYLKKYCLFVGTLIHVSTFAQSFTLGWQGSEIISKDIFLDQKKWSLGFSNSESAFATVDTNAIYIHWKFGTGNRNKWIVCFQSLNNPISLNDFSILGIDVKGSACNSNRNFRLKLEDGTNQATFVWHGLPSMQRWCNRLSVLKKQFEGTVNWSNIRVVTFEVSSDASSSDVVADSGVLAVRNLQYSDISSWQRTSGFDYLKSSGILDSVKNNALKGILNRQAPNGLFYTWKEDPSSWLYGQGLILKLLSLEGNWQNNLPVDANSKAAEKLALFLINNQDELGFWPRAWNTNDGSIRVKVEGDGTIWMGDFPWIITGLVNYYAKSGDTKVIASIQKAKSFLYSLIDPDGKFYTLNTSTNSRVEVASVEAYCAAINSVYELGDSVKAKTMLQYISSRTWDTDLLYWKEATYSSRPVLFANTWMSMLAYHANDNIKALDGLSFAGKILDTNGPGSPEGFDGIGPVATWFEGTLSYICAGGPKSQVLFDSLIKYRFQDGTIPAYNDNFGGKVDVWAVNWSSLDATSWLYYAAAEKSPFKQYYSVSIPTEIEHTIKPSLNVFPNPAQHIISISTNDGEKIKSISIYSLEGKCMKRILNNGSPNFVRIDVSEIKNGMYLISTELKNERFFEKIEIKN